MKWNCRRCGDEIIGIKLVSGLCDMCQKDNMDIDKLKIQGHTRHCACRMVFGDGICECNKDMIPLKEQVEKIIEVIKKR